MLPCPACCLRESPALLSSLLYVSICLAISQLLYLLFIKLLMRRLKCLHYWDLDLSSHPILPFISAGRLAVYCLFWYCREEAPLDCLVVHVNSATSGVLAAAIDFPGFRRWQMYSPSTRHPVTPYHNCTLFIDTTNGTKRRPHTVHVQ